ncbi:hypothetical protein VI08_14060 [Luteibacter yeojuensis]|uniref:CBM-cenC domain-containing protein n=1 Tax=Luteibacter yeojuensis TaxID=345309 RepID=A0A0F3KI32_9GAMM|nr:hypothetical protein VI08_14060 [Luteibacter yeojuensis]
MIPRAIPLGLALAAFALSAPVAAGEGGNLAGLPACSSQGNPGACRLPIVNGDFTADPYTGWERDGTVSHADGAAMLTPGSSIRQAVAINTLGDPAEAGYAVQLRVLGESDDGEVELRLALSDDQGGHAVPLASTRATVRRHAWTTVDLSGAGVPFAAPAHVLVSVANLGPSTRVQLDDVHVVESVDAF